MRERDMRERVERFIRQALRASVLPAALGVGVALGSGCRAHVSPDSGSPLTSAPGSPAVAADCAPADTASSEQTEGIPDADLFPHSLMRLRPVDAAPPEPGLKMDPGARERRLPKQVAIYTAPMIE